jgi:signal transduction histidine kinase/ActR/RegA family two-component response regulator
MIQFGLLADSQDTTTELACRSQSDDLPARWLRGNVARSISGHEKVAAALRVLRGEDIVAVARGIEIPPETLADWRDTFVAHGAAGLEAGVAPSPPTKTDKRKEAFLATLAAELRNPLAPIMNAVDVMKRQTGERPMDEMLPVIERQLGHLVRVIDELLDMGRIAHGQLQLHRKEVTLAEVVQAAVESSRPYVQLAENTLTVSLPPDPIYLNADPVRLAQVFLNLLKTKAKLSAPGGQIHLSAERDNGRVVVSVANTGSIGDTVMSDLAEEGLGVGLSLARELVEMHEGDMEAQSEGAGQFIVRLPVLGALAPAKHWRVLVVDDNADAATSLAMFLRICDHEVEVANDGVDAIETAERFRPEVIFLDIGMPRLDGYGACRRIRATSWGKPMVIVALTGWAQEEDRRKTREAGFDAHLVKPVSGVHLVELLSRVQSGAVRH